MKRRIQIPLISGRS